MSRNKLLTPVGEAPHGLFISEIKNERKTREACVELACKQMLRNAVPLSTVIQEVLSKVPKYGNSALKLKTVSLHSLWANVFKEFIPQALSKLTAAPNRCSEERLERIRELYCPRTKQDQYDNTVEDLYLSAVNDHETYKFCIKEVQKLMHTRKRKLPAGRVKYLIKESSPILVNRCTDIQLMRAWLKIFDHLIEVAVYELETYCNCAQEELKVIKKFYTPELYREQLGREINQHITKAQDHFDVVETKLEEIAMSKELRDTPVKHVTYIYGTDIEELSPENIMGVIKDIKQQIKDFNDAGVKSKYITKKVSELLDVITLLTEKLDTL